MSTDKFDKIIDDVKKDMLTTYNGTNNYDKIIRIGILATIDKMKSKMLSMLTSSEAENA